MPAAARSISEGRCRAIALQHAYSIQHRKDVEDQVFSSLEVLLELPSSLNADAAHPLDADIAQVARLLPLFQPINFDELVEERNIQEKCGYVLCPHPNQKQDTGAKYRILRTKDHAKDPLEIVETRELEKWCSTGCSRRAQYLKGQLPEEPAWARDEKQIRIEVLLEGSDGNKQSHQDHLSQEFESLIIHDKSHASREKVLAIERGRVGEMARYRGTSASEDED